MVVPYTHPYVSKMNDNFTRLSNLFPVGFVYNFMLKKEEQRV